MTLQDATGRIIPVAQRVFGASGVVASSRIRDLPGWESIKHLNFIMAMEEVLDCELEPEDLERIATIEDAARAAVRAIDSRA